MTIDTGGNLAGDRWEAQRKANLPLDSSLTLRGSRLAFRNARSKKHEQAALLLAEGKIFDEEVARAVGVSLRTIVTWKSQPWFIARIAEHKEYWLQQLKDEGLRNRQNRINELGEVAAFIKKQLFTREDVDMVTCGLAREYRSYLQQVAQELGEWVEKREQTNREPAALKAYRQEDLDLLEG